MNKDFLTPEFVEDCNRCGIRCNLNVFPWRYLGWSDEDFMNETLRFSDGKVIPKVFQKKLIAVIRTQERTLIERWEYVQKRDKAMPKQSKFGKQLELF